MADKIPDYAHQPLIRCFRSAYTMGRLLHLSIWGLGIISKRPEMVRRLITLTQEAGQIVTVELNSELEQATEDAEFTSKEKDQGFPLLHAHTLVGVWAALESGIEDTLVGILCNEPAVLRTPALAKIQIPLSRYQELDDEERMRFLLSKLQQDQASGSIQGVNLFENLLSVFNLSGPVNSSTSEAMWKMSNLRNIVVHRDSRADRRFVENCPAMNLKIGDRVIIDHDTFASTTSEAMNYVMVLVGRLATRYGTPVPKWAAEPYPPTKEWKQPTPKPHS